MNVPFPIDARLATGLLYYDVNILNASGCTRNPGGDPLRPARHDLVAGDFRLGVGQLCRETRTEHAHPAGLFQAADDVGGELAAAVAARAVAEDREHQRGELERYAERSGERIEEPDVLDDEIHGEVDVAAAVQDDL